MSISQCQIFSGHIAKGVNFFLAVGITLLFIKIGKILKPNNNYFTLSSIFLLAITTVFYKTFSQVRGETYIAFFAVLIFFLILKIHEDKTNIRWKHVISLGVTLGLLALSRQWGLFLYPGVFFALIMQPKEKISLTKHLSVIFIAFGIAALVGGWFYLYLYFEYGTVTAFNLNSNGFAFSNQPLSFYRNTGLGNFLLFESPTRKTFDNQFFPIFYSEIWGDYWGHFVFVRDKSPIGAIYGNQNQITPYLGRVNLVSLLPTVLFFAGFIKAGENLVQLIHRKNYDLNKIAFGYLVIAIVISFLGYGWFLIKYPVIPKGTTIKATYMIQIFVLLPFLGAEFLEYIRLKTTRTYVLILCLLGLVFIHNLPATFSRYWWWLR